MTDFNLYDETNAPEASRPFLKDAKAAFGFVPNLLGTMAESPSILEGYMTLTGILNKSSLTPAERQIVLLTVSYENSCTYCVAAHTVIAKGAGLSDEAIDAIRNGTALPDAKQEALAEFTRQVVRERGFASQDAVEAFLAAGFAKANIFDVVVGISVKTLSNYTNHLADTPVDAAFQPHAWNKPAAA